MSAPLISLIDVLLWGGWFLYFLVPDYCSSAPFCISQGGSLCFSEVGLFDCLSLTRPSGIDPGASRRLVFFDQSNRFIAAERFIPVFLCRVTVVFELPLFRGSGKVRKPAKLTWFRYRIPWLFADWFLTEAPPLRPPCEAQAPPLLGALRPPCEAQAPPLKPSSQTQNVCVS